MMLKLKQSVSEMALLLPRIFWALAVLGVALVAGETRPGGERGSAERASAASHADIMDAPAARRAGLGVLERK
jgi:hypothetical protein